MKIHKTKMYKFQNNFFFDFLKLFKTQDLILRGVCECLLSKKCNERKKNIFTKFCERKLTPKY